MLRFFGSGKKVADSDKVKSAYKEDGWNDLVVIAMILLVQYLA